MDFTRKYVSLILMIGSLGMLFSSVVVFGINKPNDIKLKAVPPNKIKEELELELKQKKEKKLKQEKEDLIKQKKKDRENKIIEELCELKEQRGKELLLEKIKKFVDKIDKEGTGVNLDVVTDIFSNEDIQVIIREMEGTKSCVKFLSELAYKVEKDGLVRVSDILHVHIHEIEREGGAHDINFGDVEQQAKKACLRLIYLYINSKVDPKETLTPQSIKEIFEEKKLKYNFKKYKERYWNNEQNQFLIDIEDYAKKDMDDTRIADLISMYRNRSTGLW